MSLRTLGRGSVVCVRGVEEGADGAGVDTELGCVERFSLLISARKVEKASEAMSIRVRSVKRVFSAIKASFLARKSSASLALAATSPSSCPIYSNQELANDPMPHQKVTYPFSSIGRPLRRLCFLVGDVLCCSASCLLHWRVTSRPRPCLPHPSSSSRYAVTVHYR